MIEMGKIQVNKDISPKAFLMVIIFSLIQFLIFGSFTINDFIKTRDYVKVDALITGVNHDVSWGSGEAIYSYYVNLSYTYNNNNYTNKQTVIFTFNKKVGNKMKIYVNPNNPNEVKDNHNANVSIIASLFFLFFSIGCIKAYQIRKKESIQKIL